MDVYFYDAKWRLSEIDDPQCIFDINTYYFFCCLLHLVVKIIKVL